MKWGLFVARMLAKMGRLLLFLGLAIALILPAGAQDAAGYLLPRINNLRASKGLPAYGIHSGFDCRRQ